MNVVSSPHVVNFWGYCWWPNIKSRSAICSLDKF